jgi:hypothetical protein
MCLARAKPQGREHAKGVQAGGTGFFPRFLARFLAVPAGPVGKACKIRPVRAPACIALYKERRRRGLLPCGFRADSSGAFLGGFIA